jgi:hypothetical protein
MYERIDKNSSEDVGNFALPAVDVNQAIALLQSWNVEESPERDEQRDTWEYLKKALDEDRLANRKLFR